MLRFENLLLLPANFFPIGDLIRGVACSLPYAWIKKSFFLKKQWQSKKGKERRKIPNIDHILIDGVNILDELKGDNNMFSFYT
jgi:hypothetical protein